MTSPVENRPNPWLKLSAQGPRQLPFDFLDVPDLARVSSAAKSWQSDANLTLQRKFQNAPPHLAFLAREIHSSGLPFSRVAPIIRQVAAQYFTKAVLAGNSGTAEGLEILSQRICEARALALTAFLAAVDHPQSNKVLIDAGKLPYRQRLAQILPVFLEADFRGIYSLDVSTSDMKWLFYHNKQGRLVNHIPPLLARFSNLAHLGIEENALFLTEQDVAVLGELPFLSSLSLENNRISSLPPNIRLLSGLRMLNLSNNSLKEVPGEFCELENLEILDLTGNPFPQIPLCFQVMPSLTELRISRTSIDWDSLYNFIAGIAFNLRGDLRIIADGKFLNPSNHASIRELTRRVFPYARLDVETSADSHSATFVLKKHLVPVNAPQEAGLESAKKKRRVEDGEASSV